MKDILSYHILTDSRSLTTPDKTTFIALKTSSGDGHDYIRELFDKGVRRFIVSRDICDEDMMIAAGAEFLHTSDTLAMLHRFGAEARTNFKGRVIAVTGSRGKTIVKEWIAQIAGNNTTRNPRSYNSQIGVPLSLINADKKCDCAIFEAGVSEPGEMESLEDMILPHIAVITNVTEEHDSGFATREQKIEEKLKLARNADFVVYCADDKDIAYCVETLKRTRNPKLKEIKWTKLNSAADISLTQVRRNENETVIDIKIGRNDSRRIFTTLSSDTDIENVLITLSALYALEGDNIHKLEWDKAAETLEHIDTRLTVLEGINNCKVIVDRFTRDSLSLRPALDFVRRTARTGQPLTIIIRRDSRQGNKPGYDDMPETLALLSEYGVRRLIVTGDRDSDTSVYSGFDVEFFESFNDFVLAADKMLFADETIYLNSSGPDPELATLLLGKLEARQHETVLEVNLDAIVRNYNYFRSHLNPSTGIICMLKADGYGAGAIEIAHTLELQGAEALAVAVADEGQQLREHGIKSRVMVLNPRSHDLGGMIKMNLEPVVYDTRFLDEIASAAADTGQKASIHLKFETGMRRLGFTDTYLPALIAKLKNIPEELIEVKSVFSHLATADCIGMEDYTVKQINTFSQMCDMLADAFPNRPFKRHILNTAGILRFPEAQMDSCRLGIGLYGIPTLPRNIEDGLTPVSALYTTVISVKRWPAGSTIGYGCRGVLSRDSVIATLPIGYADGIDRHFGNGAVSMMIRGIMCPTIGNICMDLCMVDVTDCPGCAPGDRVEIFGPNVPVEMLSDTLGTIPYEILTSVSQRVKRVYFRE